MKIFGKETTEQNAEKGAVNSILGRELSIVGDVSFKGKLRLDGKVEGNIAGEYLILGASGRIMGDVQIDHFICHGYVDGNVNAKKLHVMKGGTINGRVETTDILVESGAMLNGEIKSRNQDLRLIPGTSISEEEWEKKVSTPAPKEKAKSG